MTPNIEDQLDDIEEDSDEIQVTKTDPTWLRIIWADSPEKALEEYKTHALNYDGKESTSRIIKGFEGVFGNLNKAIIDLGIGLGQKLNEWVSSRPKKDAEDRERFRHPDV